MAAWIVATKTERASNLTSSQCVIELAVRLAEKESLTLFFSDGISLPSDKAKLNKIFKIDALMSNLFYKNRMESVFRDIRIKHELFVNVL